MDKLVLDKVLIEESKVSFINTFKSNVITLVIIEKYGKNDYALNVLDCTAQDLSKCGEDLNCIDSILRTGDFSEKVKTMEKVLAMCNAETDGWSVRGTSNDIKLEFLGGTTFTFEDYDLDFYLNLLCCK